MVGPAFPAQGDQLRQGTEEGGYLLGNQVVRQARHGGGPDRADPIVDPLDQRQQRPRIGVGAEREDRGFANEAVVCAAEFDPVGVVFPQPAFDQGQGLAALMLAPGVRELGLALALQPELQSLHFSHPFTHTT